MANSAILQSAGVLANNGQMYQGAQSKIFDAITQAAQIYQRVKAQKDANLSAERMKQAEIDAESAKQAQKPEAILAKAMQFGAESLTPAERATFEASQQIAGAKVAIQPQTGQAYNPYQPITLDSIGRPQQAQPSPAAEMFAPQTPATSAMLAPPRLDGGGSVEEFNKEMPPAPIGSKEDTKLKVDDSTGMGSTPVGKMEKWKSELDLASRRAEFDWNKGKDFDLDTKSRTNVQLGLDRMKAINEQLKKEGALTSEDQSMMGRAATMARGAEVPFVDWKVGRAAEKVASPKAAKLRDEYDKLRATMFPFYAKASGLSATAIDTENARKEIMNAMGDPNGMYESNKNQLDMLSGMIGTGNKPTEGVATVTEKSPYTDGQTATNPKTGEKMVFKGGQWTKM